MKSKSKSTSSRSHKQKRNYFLNFRHSIPENVKTPNFLVTINGKIFVAPKYPPQVMYTYMYPIGYILYITIFLYVIYSIVYLINIYLKKRVNSLFINQKIHIYNIYNDIYNTLIL